MWHLSNFLGVVLIFVISLQAQSQKTNDDEIFLNVTVTAKNGDWITGLKPENFKFYDQETLQPITFFSAEDAPASVGILVDKSESADIIEASELEQALTNFINKSHPDNEYFLMTFNTEQELLLDRTQDEKAVLQAIKKLQDVQYRENTKFFDAVQTGTEKISEGKHAKKVLIIISDAIDNSSKNDFGDVKKIIRQADVLLYNINIMTGDAALSILGQKAQAFSDELTDLSGGRAFYPKTKEEFQKTVFQTAEELRSQYVIGFKRGKTAEKGKKEKWHEVKIKIEIPPSAALNGKTKVRARKGYYL